MENQTENPGTKKNVEVKQTQSTTTTRKKKPNRVVKYVLKHKVSFSLFFALVVVYIWGQCAIRKLNKENETIIASTEAKLDSLNLENYSVLSNVFAWTIRGELTRNNPEQATQYLTNVIQLPHIKKAYVIDTDKKIILLSTTEAEIGLPVADMTLLQPKESVAVMNDSTVRFISPITGLSNLIGISVLEANF
ncbi:MAG: hypothetical protein ACK5KP_05600 [Paludibacteraceae bacterium]